MSENEITELTEPKLKINMLKYLSNYFNCQDEVWSTDYKRRIDIVAVHKADIERKYPIGMELKTSAKKRGKDLADWLKQANDYSTKEFIGYGKCMIITVPQVSFLYLNEGLLMNHHNIYERGAKESNVSTFLGQFGIGEFQKYKRSDGYHFMIVYSGQIIWQSHENTLHTNNYTRLCQ